MAALRWVRSLRAMNSATVIPLWITPNASPSDSSGVWPISSYTWSKRFASSACSLRQMRHFILPSSSPLAMRAGTCSFFASAWICSGVGGGRGALAEADVRPWGAPRSHPALEDRQDRQDRPRAEARSPWAEAGGSAPECSSRAAPLGSVLEPRRPEPWPPEPWPPEPWASPARWPWAAVRVGPAAGGRGAGAEGTGALAVGGLGVGATAGRGVGVGLGAGDWVGDTVPGVVAAGRRMTSTAGATRRGFRSFTFSRYLIATPWGSTRAHGLRESDRSIFHPEGSRTSLTSRGCPEESTLTVATSPSSRTNVTFVTSEGGGDIREEQLIRLGLHRSARAVLERLGPSLQRFAGGLGQAA